MIFLLSVEFFQKLTYSENYFRNNIYKTVHRLSNGLNPNQARNFVRSDLGPYQQTLADKEEIAH